MARTPHVCSATATAVSKCLIVQRLPVGKAAALMHKCAAQDRGHRRHHRHQLAAGPGWPELELGYLQGHVDDELVCEMLVNASATLCSAHQLANGGVHFFAAIIGALPALRPRRTFASPALP